LELFSVNFLKFDRIYRKKHQNLVTRNKYVILKGHVWNSLNLIKKNCFWLVAQASFLLLEKLKVDVWLSSKKVDVWQQLFHGSDGMDTQ
jgi:hypothetical protein